MQPWQRVDPTVEDKHGWRTIVTKNFILPDGKQHEFQTVNKENIQFAGVIALTKDNQVITAYQYRVGPEKMMYEIPGGGVEPHETDFQEAAMRELREETGYVSDTVSSLGVVYKDAYNNGTWHFFLAENCELHKDGQELDEHEHIAVELLSIQDFLKNARSGKMTDVEAVFLAYEKLQELERASNG